MKQHLINAVVGSVGGIIIAGRGLAATGRGIQLVGRKVESGGVTTQEYGHTAQAAVRTKLETPSAPKPDKKEQLKATIREVIAEVLAAPGMDTDPVNG